MSGVLCDDPLARCDDGNLFRLNSENFNGVFEGSVNGKSTGPIPHGERFILPNILPDTTNSLRVSLNNTTFPVCERLQDFNISSPKDVGVTLSEVKADVPKDSNATEQDILVTEVPQSLVPLSPGEGEIDVDTAPNEVLLWAATSMLSALEVIDETVGAQALFDATGGYVDLRTTGTDGPPAIAEAVTILSSRNGKAALRVILDVGKGALNVARNAAGHVIIVARTKTGLARQIMAGIAISLTRNQITNVVAGAKNQLGARAVATTASRIPVVGYVIVGAIDVIQWYADPKSRGDWSMLFSMLVVDGVALAISSAAALAAMGAFVTFVLGGAAVVTVGAAVAVAAVGLAAGFAVGAIITAIVTKTNLVKHLDAVITAVNKGLTSLAKGAIEVTGGFVEFLTGVADLPKDIQEFGQEIGDTWTKGWSDVERNLRSGYGSGLF